MAVHASGELRGKKSFMEGTVWPPHIFLTGVCQDPIQLENLVCVFEGEERPEWNDDQIDVVVEVGPDGRIMRVDTELPPNYVGPTVLVKGASFEDNGKFLVLEGEDLR